LLVCFGFNSPKKNTKMAAQSQRKSVPIAPNSATAAQKSATSAATELKDAYRSFNDRLKMFVSDLVDAYGRDFSGLAPLGKQIQAFTITDPSRMMPAHKAWPMFARARALIEKRDESVFTKHDLANLKALANVDTKVMWSKSTPKSREALWRAMEDLLDRLDEINDIRPISNDDDDEDHAPPAFRSGSGSAAAAAASSSLGDQKKSPNLADSSAAKQEGSERKSRRKVKSQKLAHDMMNTLKHMVGDDEGSLSEDFESVMKKLSDSDGSEPTDKDQELMTRLLSNFVNKIAPGAGEEDAELDAMPEKERQAEKARRTIESIQKRNRIKRAIGLLTQNEQLAKTTDPSQLQREADEAAAEKDRQEHPEKVQDMRLSAHFNYKAFLLLLKLKEKRGAVRSKKDGRILFPSIDEAYLSLKRVFVENPASRDIIESVGAFIAKNRKKLKRRDDDLFLKPTHPWLIAFNAPAIWATFKPDERDAFWDVVSHPISLATIDYDLHTGDLSDVSDIIDDILAASGVTYDTKPGEINQNELASSAFEKGVTPAKIERIKRVFTRLSNDPDQRTMRSIHKLMKHAMDQATRARGIDVNEDGDGDSSEDSSDDEKKEKDRDNAAFHTGAAKLDEIGKRLDAKFSNLVNRAPNHIPINSNPNPDDKAASITTNLNPDAKPETVDPPAK
jgi:hypothetical protein